jgi:hypothetical protein
MEESMSAFPFRKLIHDKYDTLNVMMFIEFKEVCSFMFAVNKATRTFLQTNSITIRNGYVNDGLIDYEFFGDFGHYD